MFAGNTTYVFQQAGISQSVAYDLGWGTSAIQLGANFLNMFLLYHFGRRTIYIAGFVYCTFNLLIVGVAAVYGIQGNAAAKWVQAGVQMVCIATLSSCLARAKNVGIHDWIYWIPWSYLLCDH